MTLEIAVRCAYLHRCPQSDITHESMHQSTMAELLYLQIPLQFFKNIFHDRHCLPVSYFKILQLLLINGQKLAHTFGDKLGIKNEDNSAKNLCIQTRHRVPIHFNYIYIILITT
jgi:hypothetical protein